MGTVTSYFILQQVLCSPKCFPFQGDGKEKNSFSLVFNLCYMSMSSYRIIK